MSTHLDHLLRQTLEEISDAQPPAGLAGSAVRRAGRQRILARAAVGVAAVLATALVAVPLALRAAGGDGPPSGSASPEGLFVVTAYGGITAGGAGSADDYSLLLNPTTGRYDRVPYNAVSPSPDGTRVVVHEGDNSATHPSRSGILDRRSGTVRWIPGIDGYHQAATWTAEWSPDGSRILFTYAPRQGAGGFVIVDADTLAVTTVTAGDASTDVATQNAMGLGFVWAPDGQQVALTLSRSAGDASQPDVVAGIRFYDLAGTATRTLDTTEGRLSAGTDFSPDGDRIALTGPYADGQQPPIIRIVDAVTGTVQRQYQPTTPSVVLGWYDDTHLILWNSGFPGSRPNQPATDHSPNIIQVVDLDDVTVRTAVLTESPGSTVQRVHVGSTDYFGTEAARLAF